MKLSNAEKVRLFTSYGPWAIVTGASSGIGRDLARLTASAGLNTVLTARNLEALNELSAEIRSSHGVETRVVVANMSNPADLEKLKRETDSLSIGLLIAAAGFGTSGSFGATPLEEELDMIKVNCEALFTLAHHFGNRFLDQKKGGIILLSSMVGFQGVPYAAHYAATKAYVQSLGEALAVELKSLGVDVLAAAPGPVSTGFETRANMKMGQAQKPEAIAASILKALGRKGTVLPGFFTKLLVAGLRTVPRWGKVRVMKLVMGGMTQHQRLKSS